MARNILRGALLGVAAFLSLPNLAHAAESDSPKVAATDPSVKAVRLVYEITFGGTHVGTATLDAAFTGDTYGLRTEFVSQGLLKMMSQFESRSSSHGRLTDTGASPRSYVVDAFWRGETKRTRLIYPADGGAPEVVLDPEPRAEGRDPVPAAEWSNSRDPFSTLLTVLMQTEPGAAPPPMRVFDGRRLTEARVTEVVEADIAEPGYTGPTLKAAIRTERLHGFQNEGRGLVNTRRNAAKTSTAWAAPADAFGLPVKVPVRIEAPAGRFGSAVVRLMSVEPSTEAQALLAPAVEASAADPS